MRNEEMRFAGADADSISALLPTFEPHALRRKCARMSLEDLERVALVLVKCRVTGLLVVCALKLADGNIHAIPWQHITNHPRMKKDASAGAKEQTQETRCRRTFRGTVQGCSRRGCCRRWMHTVTL
jgi:hypothetical protein